MSTLVSENKEKIIAVGLAVLLFNWYRLREKYKGKDENKKTEGVEVRPKKNVEKKFSKILNI
jgi:hypothetical protein